MKVAVEGGGSREEISVDGDGVVLAGPDFSLDGLPDRWRKRINRLLDKVKAQRSTDSALAVVFKEKSGDEDLEVVRIQRLGSALRKGVVLITRDAIAASADLHIYSIGGEQGRDVIEVGDGSKTVKVSVDRSGGALVRVAASEDEIATGKVSAAPQISREDVNRAEGEILGEYSELLGSLKSEASLDSLLSISREVGVSVEQRVREEVKRRSARMEEIYALIPSTSEAFFNFLVEVHRRGLDPRGEEAKELLKNAIETMMKETKLPYTERSVESVVKDKDKLVDTMMEFKLEKNKPSLYEAIVEGFTSQVSRWKEDPYLAVRSYVYATRLHFLASYILLELAGNEIGHKMKKEHIKNLANRIYSESRTQQQPDSSRFVVGIVADGIGGQPDGDLASELAVREIARYLLKDLGDGKPENIKELLRGAFRQAHETIYRHDEIFQTEFRMGTTASAAVIHNGKVYYASLGDTEIFVVKKNGSVVPLAGFDREGVSTVTKYLGIVEKPFEPTVGEYTLEEGDVVVVCSDGLTDNLSREEIGKIIASVRDLDAIKEELMKRATANQKKPDNVSFVLMNRDRAVAASNKGGRERNEDTAGIYIIGKKQDSDKPEILKRDIVGGYTSNLPKREMKWEEKYKEEKRKKIEEEAAKSGKAGVHLKENKEEELMNA